LIKGRAGALIFFDDYIDRPQYHFIEKYVRPFAFCGRQAIFKIPEKGALDVAKIVDSINKFRYVFD
jgi:hypothetical protein